MATKKKKRSVKRKSTKRGTSKKQQQDELYMLGGLVAGNFLSDVVMSAAEDAFPELTDKWYISPAIMGGGGFSGYKWADKTKSISDPKMKLFTKFAFLGMATNGVSELISGAFPQLQGQLGDIVRDAFATAGRTSPGTMNVNNALNGSNLQDMGLIGA